MGQEKGGCVSKTQTPRIGEEEEEAIGKQPQWGLISNSVNKCKPRVALWHKYITLKASQTQHLKYNSFVRLICVNHCCIAHVILEQGSSIFVVQNASSSRLYLYC